MELSPEEQEEGVEEEVREEEDGREEERTSSSLEWRVTKSTCCTIEGWVRHDEEE